MRIAVYVTPKAHKDEVLGWRECASGGKELAVHVSSAPEKGKATKAAIKAVAAFFNVPKSAVKCVRGDTSRHKTFQIDN